MITIDGRLGEGGGQVLRTSLALSMLTGQPFRIENIRAGRDKPGLLRQHLAAARAARDVCGAEVVGDAIGSRELSFAPGDITGGHYEFAVGTAGSATLVLQTVLPALLVASERSTLILEGGTHNPWAPPFDFLQRAFLPLVGRMGPKVSAELDRYGFYPAGGGRFRVTIDPVARLASLELVERGEILRKRAMAILSQLPMDVALRELKTVGRKLGLEVDPPDIVFVKDPVGPGNVVLIEIESEHATEIFTGFGQHGIRAEVVAEKVAREVRRYLAAGVPVGEHLADQLLVLMATAGGRFRTVAPSRHTTTNIEVIKTFLPVEIIATCVDEATGVWEIEAKKR